MKTLSTRLDQETEIAFDNLLADSGLDQSKLVRRLILDADRDRTLSIARADAAALASSAAYQRELAAIAAVMEPISAW